MKEINKLGNRKATKNTDISVKILKQNVDISGSYICNLFNVYVDKGRLPSVLKHANITHANITSYEELLTKDGSVSMHHRNIQALANEFYKIKNGLSPELFTEIFARELDSQYNPRRCND